MKIIAKLLPNNKFQIRTYRIAEGYGRPPSDDTTAESRNTRITSKYLRQLEHLTKTISSASKRVEVPYRVSNAPVLLSNGKLYEGVLQRDYAVAPACELPETMVYVPPADLKLPKTLEHLSYSQAIAKRLRLLDLLKKSQQQPKKHCNWGKKQTPKALRYQAGERLKEAGSIVDRFCGAAASTMVTLTLPGDTPTVFDALARWSGYMVNRLTQVIRRVPKNHPDIYWFFVWEHQQRGALHMHWCLSWDVPQHVRESLGRKLISKWYQVLFDIGEREHLDMYQRKGFRRTWANSPEVWQSDLQQVKSSVAAYFAKYCSKNASIHKQAHRGASHEIQDGNRTKRRKSNRQNISYPTRYWGSSQTVKKWRKWLTKSRQFTAESRAEADCVSCHIRTLATAGFEFLDVHVNEFQIEDERSGNVISSGVVETYILSPDSYPAFWFNCMDAIIEREIIDTEKAEVFRSTGREVIASMQCG